MINLLEGEKIVLIKRRHWFIIAVEGFFIVLAGFLPLAGIIFAALVFPRTLELLADYWVFAVFYLTMWFQLLLMFFYVRWTNYYLDVALITDKRIVDIEQINLFVRDVAEVRLENIQDIKVEVIGLIASLLKMGNIHIQTAGQNKEIFLESMPEPYEIKDMVSKYCNEILKESRASLSR